MASKQSEAVRELYAGWTRTRLNGEEQDNEHTFQMAAGRAPEADDAIRRMAAWVRPKLGL